MERKDDETTLVLLLPKNIADNIRRAYRIFVQGAQHTNLRDLD